ncbi:MAG TPA: hypothetical protein VK511_09815, partial [Gemmatimonadaceae bacterium]|nr:hypothetical protein [Gemmatimonadaceae bacterium]
MGDLFGPDLRNSIFAHTVHALLLGGVVVYGWQTISALVRRPTRVGRALRKAVYAAWLAALFMLTTQPNPVPYLRVAGLIAVVLLALKLWDRATAPGKNDELLTSGSAREFGREAER